MQERACILKIALCTLQKLVKSGTLGECGAHMARYFYSGFTGMGWVLPPPKMPPKDSKPLPV